MMPSPRESGTLHIVSDSKSHWFWRSGLASYALCALVLTLALPWHTVLSAQGTWYRSYSEGRSALEAQDLSRAETKLKEALAQQPKQGRAIPVPGTRLDYLPEYYLGLVYVKQGRFQEAARLLRKVLDSRLVEERHPEYKPLLAALDECRRKDLAMFKARTVKIEAVHADKSEETGTGIIVEDEKAGLYVLTALHVLAGTEQPVTKPSSIRLWFYGGEANGEDNPLLGPVDGEWIEDKFDIDLDLAVTLVRVPPIGRVTVSSWEYRQNDLERREPVFTVGHAVRDYDVSDTNVVLNRTDTDSRHFVISTAGIGPGASGGPVIDRRGYLAGILVQLEGNSPGARAVRMSEALGRMKGWGVGAFDPTSVR